MAGFQGGLTIPFAPGIAGHKVNSSYQAERGNAKSILREASNPCRIDRNPEVVNHGLVRRHKGLAK
jgi:hypothetical protein